MIEARNPLRLRQGKLTEAWQSKTCFFEYYSEPPKNVATSKCSGKRKAIDEGTSSGITQKRPHRPEMVDQRHLGTMEPTRQEQSPDGALHIPYNDQTRVNAVQKMLHRRQRVVSQEAPPADTCNCAMERMILEDEWPATPTFTPLPKRYIPLSDPGEFPISPPEMHSRLIPWICKQMPCSCIQWCTPHCVDLRGLMVKG